MKVLSLEIFNDTLRVSALKPRLKKELRYVSSTAGMQDDDWRDKELFPITDRSGNKGALLISYDENLYMTAYEMSRGIASSTTGKALPIICDFCRTWQSGTRAGSITFTDIKKSQVTVSYLCCADLGCSDHVRTKTSDARMSRAQLREDLVDEQRVARLKDRLKTITLALGVEPVSFSS